MPEKDTPTHPWLMGRWYFSLISVLVFLILSAITFFLCNRHYTINTEQTLKEDRSDARLLSLVLNEHLKKIVGVMESYGNRPALLQAVRDKNTKEAKVRLISLTKSNPDIDSVIITDRQGTLWAVYPERPEVLGKNFAYRDWYKDVSKEWKPDISDVYLRVVAEKDLAVAISIPLFDEKGEVIGILQNTQRAISLSYLFKQVLLDPGQFITVTDRKGQIIYSSEHDVKTEIKPYPFHAGMKKAMAEKNITFAVDDPNLGGRTRYISFAPVANIGWTVFVERDRRSILLSGSGYYIQVTAIAFLLFLSVILFLFYSRKQVMVRQIQEQLRAEKELQTSETRFRELFDHMSSGVAVYQAINDGEDFIISDLNEAGQKITRVYSDFIGKSVCDVFPGVKQLGLFEIFQQVWKTGKAEFYPISQYKDDRLAFWAENYVYKLPSGEIVATFNDVTERNRAEEALARSEQLLKDTQAISKVGGWEYDVEKKLLIWTDEVYQIYGVEKSYDPNDIGKAISFYSGKDQQIIEKAFLDTVHTGKPYDLELQFDAADGTKKWVRTIGKPVFKDDHIIKVFGDIADITERKHAEEQVLRQSKVLAAINSVFFETLTAGSEKAVAMTCLKVAQEITGSKFGFIGEITPEGLYSTTALSDPGWDACRIPETQATMLIKDMVIRGIWGQVLLKEQSLIVNDPVSYPDRVGIPEGHPPLTSFLGVPLKDQGKVIGMIAMANRESGYTAEHQYDMETICVAFVEAIRRKKAQEEIRKLNTELEQRVMDRTAQLEAANKEMEAFAYSVSHDLRAPLRSIDGFSQALLEEYPDKPLDDTGKTYLERVRKATQKMGFLIDDMLKLSRVSRAEFNHEAVDLSVMIREITEAHRKNKPERVVDVTVQEGVMVQGNPYLMKIVLENLMDNAWKFTGKTEHPRIEFGTAVRDGKTICYIRDNGAGFDMAYVNKLFGAFQRLHTTHEFPGTGIGLATVKRIIHRHGGQVWAEGEIGKGATFYFTLPS
jgi:PAS domain S-box-containing protein